MSDTDQSSSCTSMTLAGSDSSFEKKSCLRACHRVANRVADYAGATVIGISFVVLLACGSFYAWKWILDFGSLLNLQGRYDSNCATSFDLLCKSTVLLPVNSGNDYFNHETGEVTNDLLKNYGDCKIVAKREINQSKENLDFCSYFKEQVTIERRVTFYFLTVIVPVYTFVAAILSAIFLYAIAQMWIDAVKIKDDDSYCQNV